MNSAPTNRLSNLLRNKKILFALCFVLLGFLYTFLKVYVYRPAHNNVSYNNNNFYVLGLTIPARLDFCGEKIPSNNLAIKEGIEREFFNNAYWKKHSKILFTKAQRWFPVIEPILKKENVPSDFKYLAVIESHLSNVISPVGAAGFWQLVAVSASNYGLQVDENIDERFDVEKATYAACKHIKDAYRVFKNWTLSAAAYNRGIGGIQNALKAQNTNNYYNLMLNSETGSFVYRILAYKTLLSSPSHFGIKHKLKKNLGTIDFKVYKVDSSVTDIKHFANHIKSTVNIIKQFNPWLLGGVIPNPHHHVYFIKVPRNIKADYYEYINDLEHAAMRSDTVPQSVATIQDTLASSSNTVFYVVQAEESLQNIAVLFKIKEEDLRKWNNLNKEQNALKGQTLVIYYNGKIPAAH